MNGTGLRSPDALVLGAGGILGEAWMAAVLAGLDEAEDFDALACSSYVGTSAGSIIAATLVAGLAPESRLGRLPEQPRPSPSDAEDRVTPLRYVLGTAAGVGTAAAAPLASLAFSSTASGGALLRRAALRRLPAGGRSLADLGAMIERTGTRWDGRLRIAAVELESGRRVMFGAPDAPELPVSIAVQASCAIPGVFRPVGAGGRTYVDGGVWSLTNLDSTEVERGDHVLCLNPTGSLRSALTTAAGALAPISRGVAAAEALTLKSRGATVSTINPDQPSAAVMGTNLMDPRRRAAVTDAGLAQGRRLVASGRLKAA